ncbi:MAG: aldo/keto reductase, partial [Proteobacteria bacterium]|nr:aldo/keto reductase [Pseudomonadota bacterium]
PESKPYVDPPPMEPVYDFSRDGIMRSLEESLQRLNLDRVDVALIHDPDEGQSVSGDYSGPDHYAQAMSETFPTLADLRSQGVVRAIGVGMNQWQMLARLVRECDFDCILLAGRYTLIDQAALPELLPLCEERGISVVLGGPYNRGVLATDLSHETYSYTPPEAGDVPLPPDMLARARGIQAVCHRHDVPLKAAALQFGLAHPAVASVILGLGAPAQVEETVKLHQLRIPSEFWLALRDAGLIAEAAPVPADR